MPYPTNHKQVDSVTSGGTGDPAVPLDPKDYEIAWLKVRNEQLHQRVVVLEQQLADREVS